MTPAQTLLNYLRFGNGFQVLINRLIFRKTGPTIYHHENLTFLVDHEAGDQDGPRACVFPGLYDPFLNATDLRGEVSFVDLGANAGGFVLSLLKAGLEPSTGICVELNPVTWSRLVYNVFRNVPSAVGKIKLLNGAVADSAGVMEIRLGNGGVGDNIGGTLDGDLYSLQRYTLDHLATLMPDGMIDILKIDIEGSEYEIFSAPQEILCRVRWLLIEIHEIKGQNSRSLKELFEKSGFLLTPPTSPPIEDNVFLFRNITA